MTTALYTVWLLIPAFFFLLALWGLLENFSSRKGKKHKPGDQLKQGIFVLFCVLICIGLDRTVLEDVTNAIFPEWLPLEFFRALLLPLVLYLGALLIGPSKPPQSNLGNRRLR